jgi:hypothetical protein
MVATFMDNLTNQEIVSVCVALPLPFIMIWTAITFPFVGG